MLSLRTRSAVVVGAAVLGLGGLVATAPVATAAPARQHSVTASCSVTWRNSANYHGYTAGYSWAWNVVISKGDTGDRVREIQCLTQFWGSNPGAVDGDFGQNTKNAVIEQQKACGITADGVVGPATWRCLRDGGHN
ncbi:peptidoglycan-binding domain-containing protein [Streptomyces sp. NPDC052051]|uniref:peptidoglycan-binding domain-containing protein n=1 Tax=Streptomyces sp. NPDC052051 TaxID=3154649 RepID=UPI003447F163